MFRSLNLNRKRDLSRYDIDQQRFDETGYCVLEGFFNDKEIDFAAEEVRKLVEEKHEICCDNLKTNERSLVSFVPTADIQSGFFKLNDMHLISKTIQALALNSDMTNILSTLMGQAPVCCNSLYFERSSQQTTHVDSIYMTPTTPTDLIAIWVALEDVHPEAGPLFYYPGSSKIPAYQFSNGGRRAVEEEMDQWLAYRDAELAKLGQDAQHFMPKKGDVFIWHAQLFHGGAAVSDPELTRKSFVFHYFSERDCVSAGHEIVPASGGQMWQRGRQSVRPNSLPPEDAPFPEQIYLARHPDVAKAVANGKMKSGEYHYRHFGFAEKREI